MARKNLPDVGDVITSSKFAYGYYEREDNQLITMIDGITEKYYDSGRAKAKFVVETANMEGGGTAHGHGDVYPDGWHVRARRLNDDGTYNQNGELIQFYMSGSFTCMVYPKDVQVVGKMQLRFV